MSIEILRVVEGDVAVFTDSVTGWAFGPVIGGPDADEKAQHFLEYLLSKNVALSSLRPNSQYVFAAVYAEWLQEHVCADCSVLVNPPDTVHMHGCKHYEAT